MGQIVWEGLREREGRGRSGGGRRGGVCEGDRGEALPRVGRVEVPAGQGRRDQLKYWRDHGFRV